jgi:HD-GYP domain-containing protein (c-di-GMP phosphodiesterase class II)
MSNGRAAAIKEVASRANTWFDPSLVDVFFALADDDEFWDVLASPDLGRRVMALEPTDIRRKADEAYLDDVALGFAKVVDAKSPFTGGHSERVAVFTDLIAEGLGMTVPDRRSLRRAALLHDVGKLGISNSILDKPAKLTDDEFASIKMHPVYSGEILFGIPSFQDIAEVGLNHHEKLNGKGYPHGIKGSQISLATRIVTVADVFDALTADRPYRAAMPVTQALSIMTKEVNTAFDPDCFNVLERAMKEAVAA